MQFPNLEDEDADFGLNTRSRLSSLFPSERPSGDVNQALTFTAPKQPKNKKNENLQSNQETMKLIHATTVHAYKLVDGSYTNQGKLGCAILGLHEARNYRLLLYKGKQIQVATSTIFPDFKFHVQPNNYATFYDERNENWSINFESDSALLTFAKQIAISRANAQDKNQVALIIQDLVLGEGPTLDTGDAAEVKYTGWILSDYTFGQVFDSNLKSESAFRLRLGKKVIKGWSEGLIGAQKGTKRLLVVPPNLAYGAEGMGKAVPPNSTLIFEILVIKVKVSRESSHSPGPSKTTETIPEKKPEVVPRHSSVSSEDNIRLRGASISEQLTQSPKKDKAQLISRMAKMGTATLPFQGAIPAQVASDSENEEDIHQGKSTPPTQLSRSRTSSPKLSRPTSRKNSDQLASVHPTQLQSVQDSIQFQAVQQPNSIPFYSQTVMPPQQSYPTPTNAFPPFQPQLTSQYQIPQMQYSPHAMPGVVSQVPSMADTHLPMLITESRSQNTEVRLSLSKITEKVDTVMQKVDDLRLNQGKSGTLSHPSFMDSAILVQSIEKIVQENNQLKEDVEAKSAKIQLLNEKICDLLQRNQRFFEESNNMLEQKSGSLQAASVESQAKLYNLEKEKLKLSSELSDTLEKLASAEDELVSYQSLENTLKQRLQQEEKRTQDLKSELSTLQNKSNSESENSLQIHSIQREMKDLSNENSVLKAQLKDWEENFNTLNSNYSEKTKELQSLQELLERKKLESENSLNKEDLGKIEAMKREIENIQVEKKEIISKYEDLQTKLSESTKSEAFLKKKIDSLQVDLQNALMWKEKHEIFYQKTRQMKENYEREIQNLIMKLEEAQVSTSSSDFSGEIKKVMNVLYKMLQGKFEPKSSYTGAEILGTTLQAIRGLTFQMLQNKGQRSDSVPKESDSASSTETVVPSSETGDSNSNTVNSLESQPMENSPQSSGDFEKNTESVQEKRIEENGISDETSLPVSEVASSEVHSVDEKHLPEGTVSKKSEQCENNSIKDSSIHSESNDQPFQNNINSQSESQETSKKNEELKSMVDKIEASKTVNRVSPDCTNQLTSTNTSDHSLFETDASKVFDGSSTVHA